MRSVAVAELLKTKSVEENMEYIKKRLEHKQGDEIETSLDDEIKSTRSRKRKLSIDSLTLDKRLTVNAMVSKNNDFINNEIKSGQAEAEKLPLKSMSLEERLAINTDVVEDSSLNQQVNNVKSGMFKKPELSPDRNKSKKRMKGKLKENYDIQKKSKISKMEKVTTESPDKILKVEPEVSNSDSTSTITTSMSAESSETVAEIPKKEAAGFKTMGPFSIEAQKILFKNNNLFKGVSREKVCQYCFEPDQVHKCTGGCNCFYHAKCAKDVVDLPFKIYLTKQRSRTLFQQPSRDGTISESTLSVKSEELSSVILKDNKEHKNNTIVATNVSMIEKTQNERDTENIEAQFDEIEDLNLQGHVEIITINEDVCNLSLEREIPEHIKEKSLADQIDYKMRELMSQIDNSFSYYDLTESTLESSTSNYNSNKTTTLESSTPNSVSKPDSITTTGLGVKLRNRINSCLVEYKPKLRRRSMKLTNQVPSINHVTAESDALHKNNSSFKHVTAEHDFSNNAISLKRPSKSISVSPGSTTSNKSKNSIKKSEDFTCGLCESSTNPFCLVCHKNVSKNGSNVRQKCSITRCGRFYHPECLKEWPQTQWSFNGNSKKELDSFICPSHVCHTCVSSDLWSSSSRCTTEKVARCLQCPATYHTTNFCIPAGSQILTLTQIICPRHRKQTQRPLNTTWCFLCNLGGDLFCCEFCPTSVHAECMPIDFNDDGKFICEDCQSGRMPLYDEVVWAKLGHWRWWPAIILFPNEIPQKVMNAKHSSGDFVVRFFGSLDHSWVNMAKSFLFQEGDTGHTTNKRTIDSCFIEAIKEATIAHRVKNEFKQMQGGNMDSNKPPPYVRIKVNRPVGNVRLDLDSSNATPCSCDPNQPNPCGPDTNCLNRLLLTECNPQVCPAGDKCNNQQFEKRQYPKVTPYRTESRGWGLKTLVPISQGSFVLEYVGELIDAAEYQRRLQRMHEQKEENYYFLTITNNLMIDAGPKGNVARFMNHCCQPNCETQKWTVNGNMRVGLFASCDIPAGAELTFNYNLECVGEEKKVCRCGAPNCSGYIGVKAKQPGESENRRSRKSIKKEAPVVESPAPSPPCFLCGKNGKVGLCNNKECTKAYHLECLQMTSWPKDDKFVCSWHNCNICSRRTKRCCIECMNSYCPNHSEGNVRYDKVIGYVCSEHDPANNTKNVKPVCEEGVSDSEAEENLSLSELRKKIYGNKNETVSDFNKNVQSTSTPLKSSKKLDHESHNGNSSMYCSDSEGVSLSMIPKRNRKRNKKKSNVQNQSTTVSSDKTRRRDLR